MNREQKRGLEKSRAGSFNSSCTLAEAVQIARASAEDVVSDYHRQQSHLQVAISLQIEILKELVINNGLITEEKFRELYREKAEEFNRLQQESLAEMSGDLGEEEKNPKMEVKPDNIEVTAEA